MLAGLPKYAGQRVRQRGSSPKLEILNTALMTATSHLEFGETRTDTDYWGRLVESAVGATLANGLVGKNIDLFYWSSRNREVDFVISRGDTLAAIEVKSGRRKGNLPGVEAFSREFKVKRKILVGSQGIALGDFLLTPPEEWVK